MSTTGKLSLSSIIKKTHSNETEIREVITTIAKNSKGKTFILPRNEDLGFNSSHPDLYHEFKEIWLKKEKNAISQW